MSSSSLSQVEPVLSAASTAPAHKTNIIHQLNQLLVDAEGKPIKSAAPVEQWNPPYCGEIDIRIKANGDWWHEGTKMTRQSLVNLFATVLWREGNDYFLKTPAEKVKIQVEDVPLLVTNVEQVNLPETPEQLWVRCTTQTGDVVLLDDEHPIFFKSYQGEIRPYVHIRRNLDALLHRNAFFHVLAWGQLFDKSTDTSATTVLQLSSGPHQFELAMDY